MSKFNRDELIEKFEKNYASTGILNMLLDRMTDEEISKELDSFESIANDPENSETAIQ